MSENDSLIVQFTNTLYYMFDTPVTFFREKIVEPNQKKYPWYHQKFRRVPTIDECYSDDKVCEFEADQQFLRDKKVDDEILNILRKRYEQCKLYNQHDGKLCQPLYEIYEEAAAAWFTKYGDLGNPANARRAYMKQKHRMIWERRHGPVGSGMKEEPFKIEK